jgi:hypothetical protein
VFTIRLGMLGMLAVLVHGCATDPLPIGAVCDAPADCADGLTCLELGQINGTSCMVVAKVCTSTCIDDTGCAMYGANFKCFASCGLDKICGEVATP